MKERFISMLLCVTLCLCVFLSAAASGIETDEDGGTWDYGRGIYTDPTGQQHQISNDGDSGGSGSSTNTNNGNAMIIDTGEADPMAGAKKNSDGSIEVESGTGGVDIEIEPTRAPLEGEDWQAALDSVVARNGKDTPTVWTDPATGVTVQVDVVYMGIGRSMIIVDGEKKLVNTVDLKWETEAPENKVLAVVRSRYVWLHKAPSNDKTVLKFKQVYRDSVVRVLATGKNWTFVDHEGDMPLHTHFTGSILEGFQPGTPVTVFDILEDYDYAEIDVAGLHCVVKLNCLTLESSLTASAQ